MAKEEEQNVVSTPEEQPQTSLDSSLTRQIVRELPSNMRREACRKLQFVISKQDRGEHLSSADVARLREVTRTY